MADETDAGAGTGPGRRGQQGYFTELEQELDRLTDWREHVRQHPRLALGLAFALGVLMALRATAREREGRGTAES